MNGLFRPRLRHCTLIKEIGGSNITVVVGKEYFRIAIDGENSDKFLRLKSMMDGRRSISEIAAELHFDEIDVIEVVQQFEEMGLLRKSNQVAALPSSHYMTQIELTSEMWARQIGYHKIFGELAKGVASKRVLIGLILETYHYVASATKHIATAISHAKSIKERQLLARYLCEECSHEKYFETALEKMDVSLSSLASACPTVGTRSLINMLCEIGSRSTFSYICCTNLFEARAQNATEAERELREIFSNYGLDQECVDPLIRHMKLDISAGHTSLLRRYLNDIDEISSFDAHNAVNDMHDLKHAFDQFHDQILSYYGDISNYVPRPKVDYFCL